MAVMIMLSLRTKVSHQRLRYVSRGRLGCNLISLSVLLLITQMPPFSLIFCLPVHSTLFFPTLFERWLVHATNCESDFYLWINGEFCQFCPGCSQEVSLYGIVSVGAVNISKSSVANGLFRCTFLCWEELRTESDRGSFTNQAGTKPGVRKIRENVVWCHTLVFWVTDEQFVSLIIISGMYSPLPVSYTHLTLPTMAVV